jgi:hypothetical protein
LPHAGSQEFQEREVNYPLKPRAADLTCQFYSTPTYFLSSDINFERIRKDLGGHSITQMLRLELQQEKCFALLPVRCHPVYLDPISNLGTVRLAVSSRSPARSLHPRVKGELLKGRQDDGSLILSLDARIRIRRTPKSLEGPSLRDL